MTVPNLIPALSYNDAWSYWESQCIEWNNGSFFQIQEYCGIQHRELAKQWMDKSHYKRKDKQIKRKWNPQRSWVRHGEREMMKVGLWTHMAMDTNRFSIRETARVLEGNASATWSLWEHPGFPVAFPFDDDEQVFVWVIWKEKCVTCIPVLFDYW